MERPSGGPAGRLAASLFIGGLAATAAWHVSGAGSARPGAPGESGLSPSPPAIVMLAAPAPVPAWRGCALPAGRRGQRGGDASRVSGARHPGTLIDPTPLSTPSSAQRPGTLGQAGGDALAR